MVCGPIVTRISNMARFSLASLPLNTLSSVPLRRSAGLGLNHPERRGHPHESNSSGISCKFVGKLVNW